MSRWNPSILIAAGLIFGLALFLTWPLQSVAPAPTIRSGFVRWLYDWQTLITGLIALGVGLAAWRVIRQQIDSDRRAASQMVSAAREDVDRQIAADRDLETASRNRRLVAVLRVLTTDLMMLRATAMAVSPGDPVPDFPGSLAKALVVETSEADGILAACLVAHIVQIDAMHRRSEAMMERRRLQLTIAEPQIRNFEAEARMFAARSKLLAVAMNRAADRIRALGRVHFPLITENEIDEAAADHEVAVDISYLAPLREPDAP